MTDRRTAMARLVAATLLALLSWQMPARAAPAESQRPLLAAPIWIYNNWSAYDELSDHVQLSESLAMRELDEVLRLRRLGVRFDYYTMDAFWYDRDGGYRTWRAADWPHGPDRWLAALETDGIKPGLWFSTNTLTHMRPVPRWRDSLDKSGWAMALYRGGFLHDFMDVLDYWYGRGIRMFKFDMANFDAVAKVDDGIVTPHEARTRNIRAFHAALQDFRQRHPDVVLIGFNGLVGDVGSTAAPVRPLNATWLDVFDTFYSGDPRPSNVPETNFWRSVDIYSDHMVRSFDQAGVPLSRIDSTSVMLGDTGTNYRRRAAAWRGSVLLMASHGSWINTVHGDLAFLNEADARWLAKIQALYDPLQRDGVTKSFGGIPGDAYPYGFASLRPDGALYTVVNPSQRVRDVRIPSVIERIPAEFAANGSNSIAAAIVPPASGDLRIILRQVDASDAVVRSFSRRNMAQIFVIRVTQGGKPVPLEIHYDKIVWSGLGWAAGEIRHADLASDQPLEIHLTTADPKPGFHLEGRVYRVEY